MKLGLPSRWHQLAKLNELKLIKTMYLWIFVVPIAARLFQSVEDTARITVFEHSFAIYLTLPFSWVVFYLSALAFAVANVIFEIRCPRIVKEHVGYGDFRAANKGVEHLDNYMHEVGMNWEGLRQQPEREDEYFSEIAEAQNPRSEDGMLRRRFWAVHSQGDRWRPKSRLATLLLYIIGLLLITFVLLQNTWFVASYLAR